MPPAVTPQRQLAEGSRLAQIRERFLSAERVESSQVRDTILASWTRSREWDVPAGNVELSCAFDCEPDSPLTRAASPVLADVADQFAGEPVSVILTDSDGVVLERRTGDSTLHQHLNKVWLGVNAANVGGDLPEHGRDHRHDGRPAREDR